MDLRFFLCLKKTSGVISVVERRKFYGKHFLFNVCLKSGVGKGAERMTLNMDTEVCVSVVHLEEIAYLPA